MMTGGPSLSISPISSRSQNDGNWAKGEGMMGGDGQREGANPTHTLQSMSSSIFFWGVCACPRKNYLSAENREGEREKKNYVVSKGLPVSEGWKGVGFQSISGSESLARPVVVSLRARHEPKKPTQKTTNFVVQGPSPVSWRLSAAAGRNGREGNP